MQSEDKKPVMTVIPFLHPKIDLADLDENQKLIIGKKFIDEGYKLYLNEEYNPSECTFEIKTREINGREYALYKILGMGGYGRVHLAQDSVTGEWVALKLQPHEKVAKNEFHLLKAYETHPGKAMVKNFDTETIDEKKTYMIIMSVLSGTDVGDFINYLRDELSNELSDDEYLRLIIGLCEAIDDLNHKYNILHRDIKPANFIYHHATGKVTAIDFGCACEANKEETNLKVINTFAVGMPHTQAPECQFSEKTDSTHFIHSELSEAYAVGKTIAEILKLYKKEVKPIIIKNQEYPLINLKYSKSIELPIANTNLRKEVFNILKEMTQDSMEERINLASASQKFRKLQKKYLQQKKRELSIGILDLAQWLKPTNQKNIIRSLRKCNRILLVNSNSNLCLSANALQKLKKGIEIELDKQLSSCIVSNTILSGLPYDQLEEKSCEKMQITARRGAYHFNFHRINSNGQLEKIDLKNNQYNKIQLTQLELADIDKTSKLKEVKLPKESYETKIQEEIVSEFKVREQNQSAILQKLKALDQMDENLMKSVYLNKEGAEKLESETKAPAKSVEKNQHLLSNMSLLKAKEELEVNKNLNQEVPPVPSKGSPKSSN